jgi:CSLREA domain-containing protein
MSHRALRLCIFVSCARRLACGWAVVCAALLVALGTTGSQDAHAAPSAGIIVNDLGDNTTGGNGKCTLREAITNANANSDTTGGDCAAGSGTDTISFSVSGTIVVSPTLPSINDDLTIDGSGQSITVSGNHAVRVLVVNGGKTLSLNALTIANGTAVDCIAFAGTCGGGAFNNGGTLNVTNSTFSGNSAASDGGAIYNTVNSTLNVTNSTFSGNSASCCAGGGIENNATMTVTDSTFTANVSVNGGGIANYSHLTVSNSTFGANNAFNGGAIFNDGPLTVANSTFSANGASNSGGAIYQSGFGGTTLRNTIVANSTSGGNCAGGIGDGGHNLRWPSSDTTCVGAFGDPKLGPLTNNGGSTQTLALLAGSAAIDAGDDAVCAAAPVNNLDQRGKLRTQGAHCDSGAFEADEPAQSGPNFVVSRTTDHDDGICGVADCTLREAINAANAHGGADTVTFVVTGTIGLGATLPAINDDLTIDGTGKSITVSGHSAVRVMVVNSGKTLSLNRLTIANGLCDTCDGGGIYNSGTLNVTNSTFSGNSLKRPLAVCRRGIV